MKRVLAGLLAAILILVAAYVTAPDILRTSTATVTGTSTLTSSITETAISYANATTSAATPGSECCASSSPQSVATTITQTGLSCNYPGTPETDCLYLSGWGVNYTSSELFIVVAAQNNTTLANATFSGSPANKGFIGSVTVNLNSMRMNDTLQAIFSPPLPNLQRGDTWTVTVRGTAEMYFAANFTETAGSQN